jgi:polysaccharide biosynthesis protein PslH
LTQTTKDVRQEHGTGPSERKLRVLHFVPRLCWPLNTGAKLRNYHLARELSRRAKITLLAFSENDDDRTSSATRDTSASPSKPGQDAVRAQQTGFATEPLLAPERFYESVTLIGREQGYTPAKIVRGALGRTPLPVLNYTTDAMKRALERILSEHEFDVVQVESIHLMAYLPLIRAAKSRPLVILDWHNIESELLWRYSERATNPLRRLYARRTSRQLSSLERRAVEEFDAHIVVSERDGAKLLENRSSASVFVIENGVDTAHYSDEQIRQAGAAGQIKSAESPASATGVRGRSATAGKSNRIVFVASMDYHANVDAAVNFAREVWPQLHETKPELIFTIVGRDPAPEVRQLASLPGVEVTGTVDDVRPYYQEAVMAVIPLRVGGGSRLKILEAMAAGVPVISTTLGAEGLEIRDGENLLVADTDSEMREAIIAVAEDAEQRRKLSEAGRALVFERYDWSRLGAALFDTYQDLTAAKSHPAN